MIQPISQGYSVNLTIEVTSDSRNARFSFRNPNQENALRNSPYYTVKSDKSFHSETEFLDYVNKSIDEAFVKFTTAFNKQLDHNLTITEQFKKTEARAKADKEAKEAKEKANKAIKKAAEELSTTMKAEPLDQDELSRKIYALTQLDAKHSLIAQANALKAQASLF